MTLFVAVAFFNGGIDSACKDLFDKLHGNLDIVRMADLLPGFVQKFFPGIADHVTQGGIHPPKVALQVDKGHAAGRLVEHCTKTVLAAAQGLFRFFAGGDIKYADDDVAIAGLPMVEIQAENDMNGLPFRSMIGCFQYDFGMFLRQSNQYAPEDIHFGRGEE